MQSSSILQRLDQICERVAVVGLLSLALVQLWQVLARYLFNESLAWSEPLSVLLLSVLMSFASASAVHRSGHFRFAWLSEKLPAVVRLPLTRAIALLLAFSCIVLAWKAGMLAINGNGVKQAGINLPVGAVYWPASMAMAIASVFAVVQVFTPMTQPPSPDSESQGH